MLLSEESKGVYLIFRKSGNFCDFSCEWMKAKAIAGNLKNAGLSIAEIAKVNGLSADEINSL